METRTIPTFVEHLSDPASPTFPAFLDLDCSQIFHDGITHLIQADNIHRLSISPSDATGFDVNANYWDASYPSGLTFLPTGRPYRQGVAIILLRPRVDIDQQYRARARLSYKHKT